MLALTSFITRSSTSPYSLKLRVQTAHTRLYKITQRFAQKSCTVYRWTQGLARSALVITEKTRRTDCLEVFFTVMQTIKLGRRLRVCRWRVWMDKWIEKINVRSAKNSFHIHPWLRITIIISSSNIAHSSIIHHTCWKPLPTTTTNKNHINTTIHDSP